jgi:hypothetical protein
MMCYLETQKKILSNMLLTKQTVTFSDTEQTLSSRTRNPSTVSKDVKHTKASITVNTTNTQTGSNIGKPIVRFKAHTYQIYLQITKQDKTKEVQAAEITHTNSESCTTS